jgi:hypothetical protein
MKKLWKHGLCLLTLVSLSACATSGRSTLLGTGVGAGVGAGIGALADPGPKGEGRIRNVFIGAAAGSLIGAGAGYLGHELVEKKERAAYEKGKKDSAKDQTGNASEDSGAPVLIPPRVESRFVEEQVRGNVFVPAHFEYVIVEPARWSR